jgi:hypothetical protein
MSGNPRRRLIACVLDLPMTSIIITANLEIVAVVPHHHETSSTRAAKRHA